MVFCERQCALIHLEQVWLESGLTAAGSILHKGVHEQEGESRAGVRVERGLAFENKDARNPPDNCLPSKNLEGGGRPPAGAWIRKALSNYHRTISASSYSCVLR
jgi:hypothetical protein